MNDARLVRFRACIEALNPAVTADAAMAAGWHVDNDDLVGHALGAALELDPGSAHAIVGGIGSGKTTQLRWVEQNITVQDIRTRYVDLPSVLDLGNLQPGSLLAAVGYLVTQMDRGRAPFKDASVVRNLAVGAWVEDTGDEDWYPDESGPQRAWVPGLLRFRESWSQAAEFASALENLVRAATVRPVILLDGLDRLASTTVPGEALEAIRVVLDHDVPVVRSAGVGVALTVPFALQWTWADGLDHVFQGNVHSVRPLAHDQAFLAAVLDKRVPDMELLPSQPREELAALSGGLVRDLLTLTRSSVQAAYAAGASQVGEAAIEVARDRFAAALDVGLSGDARYRLRKWRHVHAGKPEQVADFELASRRILVQTATGQLRLHPTLSE